MSSIVLLLAIAFSVAAEAQPSSHRIVGGELTTIDQYPFQAGLLSTQDLAWFTQYCGGTILNTRSILTAAHCYGTTDANWYRVRVGSSYANSGGEVHAVALNILHPSYNSWTYDSDIAVVRLQTTITFNNFAQPGAIAGTNYNLADNQVVWATGWGDISFGGGRSEQLRHVQIWTVNQQICNERYAGFGGITENMLCSGWLDVGGRDQCTGDSGGPLIHNNVIVGVCSWGAGCGLPSHPGVNTRVSRYTAWIQANA